MDDEYMRIDLNKNLFRRGHNGWERKFLYFPRYIEGYIVWLEWVHLRYEWQMDYNVIYQRVRKKYLGYVLIKD